MSCYNGIIYRQGVETLVWLLRTFNLDFFPVLPRSTPYLCQNPTGSRCACKGYDKIFVYFSFLNNYFFTLARERPLEEVTNKVIIVGYFYYQIIRYHLVVVLF